MADPDNPYHFPGKIHVFSSVILKFNNKNYLLWKTQFESLMSSQMFIGSVNGAVTSPDATRTVFTYGVQNEIPNPHYESWYCTYQFVRCWLFGTLSEEVLGHVHNLTTSRDVWLSLAENFNKSLRYAEVFSLSPAKARIQPLTVKNSNICVTH